MWVASVTTHLRESTQTLSIAHRLKAAATISLEISSPKESRKSLLVEKVAHSRHAVEEIFQLVEAVIDFRCDLGNVVFQQLSCGLEMPLTQGLQQGSERICIAARGLLTHEYKLIGDLSQGTNHHNSPMPPTGLCTIPTTPADGLRIS